MLQGRVAYVPQIAWILNATVKNNITFGKRFNSNFYNEVIRTCALEADLEILPGGDMTEIGEKVINGVNNVVISFIDRALILVVVRNNELV